MDIVVFVAQVSETTPPEATTPPKPDVAQEEEGVRSASEDDGLAGDGKSASNEGTGEDREGNMEASSEEELSQQASPGQKKDEQDTVEQRNDRDSGIQDTLEVVNKPGDQDTARQQVHDQDIPPQQDSNEQDQIREQSSNLGSHDHSHHQDAYQDTKDRDIDDQDTHLQEEDRTLEKVAHRESTGDQSSRECVSKKPGDCQENPTFPTEEEEPEYGTWVSSLVETHSPSLLFSLPPPSSLPSLPPCLPPLTPSPPSPPSFCREVFGRSRPDL